MFDCSGQRTVRRFIGEVLYTWDTDNIETFISSEYTGVYEGDRYSPGIAGGGTHIPGIRAICPDLVITVVRQIVEVERVAGSVTPRGTHLGTRIGTRPAGQSVTFTGVSINRVVGGKIAEHGGAVNMMKALQVIGAEPTVDEETP